MADAILFSFYSGLEGGNALADVLSGDVNPGGKLPFTVCFNDTDYPKFLHISDKEREIDYGYYHGYTLMDKKNIEPQYPFGFGLSYTQFELENACVTCDDKAITVQIDVKNIGDVDGEEVVQVYISSNNTDVDRPVKLLKGFKRIAVKTNSVESVKIDIPLDEIKFYSPETGDWVLDKNYSVLVGTSSKNAKKVAEAEF